MRNVLVFIVGAVAVFATKAETYDEDQLIDAIAYVESKYNEKAVSSDGTCVGYLQIKAVLVEECNRIVGRRTYTKKDRFSKGKSKEMFRIIQGHYNPAHDLEIGIRLWNEGPGYKKHPNRRTKYLKTVLRRYNSNRGK